MLQAASYSAANFESPLHDGYRSLIEQAGKDWGCGVENRIRSMGSFEGQKEATGSTVCADTGLFGLRLCSLWASVL